jgi:hypothetical protein
VRGEFGTPLAFALAQRKEVGRALLHIFDINIHIFYKRIAYSSR